MEGRLDVVGAGGGRTDVARLDGVVGDVRGRINEQT